MTDSITTLRAEEKRERAAYRPTAIDEALSAAIEKHMPYEIDAFGVDRYDAHLVVEHLRTAGFDIVPMGQTRRETMVLPMLIALVTRARNGRVKIKAGDIMKARSKVLTVTLSTSSGLELRVREEDEVRAENEAIEAEVAEIVKKAKGASA